MIAKRGCVPEDEKFFSPDAVKTLRKASAHVFYLLNEGYDLKQAKFPILSRRKILLLPCTTASAAYP